jgi:hypothetical protein
MRSMMGGSDLYGDREVSQAVTGAVQHKALTQQQGSTPTNTKPSQQTGGAQRALISPREVSSFSEELIKRPLHDLGKELKLFVDLNELLGIAQGDTPEEQVKKKQLHQRYQQLTQAEQQVAKQKYQEKLQRRQEEEKAKEQKRQEEQAKPSLPPPTGKKNLQGMFGMVGSQKKQAAQRLAFDRQRIGKLMNAG